MGVYPVQGRKLSGFKLSGLFLVAEACKDEIFAIFPFK